MLSPMLRRPSLLLTLCLPLLTAGAARAGVPADAGGFHFAQPAFSVHESGGQALITIERSEDLSQGAQIRYITMGVPIGTAVTPWDFTAQKGMLNFPAGVTSESFSVPIVDHGVNAAPKTIQLSLFGAASYPVPIGLGDPATATLTILNDDAVAARDASNPLMLPLTPSGGDPLSGARFYVDPDTPAALASAQYPALKTVAEQPATARFGSFSKPNVQVAVSNFLTRAAYQQPGTIPQLTTYRIVDGHCGNYTPPPSSVASYEAFMRSFADGIGSHPAVLFLEEDAIITSPCYSRHGLSVHLGELHYAIDYLNAHCPHLVVYLDAGAADALPASVAASWLKRAGVGQIQGFFLNSTHFDWTSSEIRYGEQISKLTGGKHFVVSTDVNGQGPLVPKNRVKQGNEVLCNPPGRGLGPVPTTHTGYRNVDAFAWIGIVGDSGGACVPGAPATGVFWPAYALGLVANANFKVR
jgi:endoglucanase